jgi:hypothetical protein
MSPATVVLEGHQNNFQPQGRLDGKLVKVSWVWTEVASVFGSTGFIIGEWDPPKAPNLTSVGCEAHYIIRPAVVGDRQDPVLARFSPRHCRHPTAAAATATPAISVRIAPTDELPALPRFTHGDVVPLEDVRGSTRRS